MVVGANNRCCVLCSVCLRSESMSVYIRSSFFFKFNPLMLLFDLLFMSVCMNFCDFYGSGVIVCGFPDLHIRKVIKMESFDLSIILTFLLLHYAIKCSFAYFYWLRHYYVIGDWWAWSRDSFSQSEVEHKNLYSTRVSVPALCVTLLPSNYISLELDER